MDLPITPHHRLRGDAHDAKVVVVATVERVVALDGWGGVWGRWLVVDGQTGERTATFES